MEWVLEATQSALKSLQEQQLHLISQLFQVGEKIKNGAEAEIKSGNCLPLRNIPVGSTIHCVEILPKKGAQLARSAGASVQLLAKESQFAQLRMRSGEVRKVHIDCRATLGEVGNEEHIRDYCPRGLHPLYSTGLGGSRRSRV